MNQPQRSEIGIRHRVRLIGALLVLSGLAAICAVGIGATLHHRSETLDSLAHWQAQAKEAGVDGAPGRATGLDSPVVRIRRLEAELDAVPGRLFPMGIVFVLATVLVFLGYRALRRGGRAP